MGMYTLLYLKWITNKDLLYRTGSSNSVLRGSPGGEGGLGEMDPCVCVSEPPSCSHEVITTLLVGCTPTQNKKLKKKKDERV